MDASGRSVLAEKVLKMTGSASPIEFLPLPADDPVQRWPNINRAGDPLGWQPRVPLEDGLRRTMGYFEERLSQATSAVVLTRKRREDKSLRRVVARAAE
jgi:nucleoside-diphosphate-sugar epimerase